MLYHFWLIKLQQEHTILCVILNVAFVGASILSLASTGGSTLGLAFLAACVAISVKTQFSDQIKAKDTSQLIKGMFKVFQQLFNVSMEQQF